MNKYYSILNIAPDANLCEIKKAFRKTVQLCHPDVNGGVGNPDMFKEVVKAYRYLEKYHKAQTVSSKKNGIVSACRIFFQKIGSRQFT